MELGSSDSQERRPVPGLPSTGVHVRLVGAEGSAKEHTPSVNTGLVWHRVMIMWLTRAGTFATSRYTRFVSITNPEGNTPNIYWIRHHLHSADMSANTSKISLVGTDTTIPTHLTNYTRHTFTRHSLTYSSNITLWVIFTVSVPNVWGTINELVILEL